MREVVAAAFAIPRPALFRCRAPPGRLSPPLCAAPERLRLISERLGRTPTWPGEVRPGIGDHNATAVTICSRPGRDLAVGAIDGD
jgi:hypothetical protein